MKVKEFLTDHKRWQVKSRLRGLKDDNPRIRKESASWLGKLAEQGGYERIRASGGVVALSRSLKDSDPKVRSAACVALGRMSKTGGTRHVCGSGALMRMLNLLSDKNEKVVLNAAWAIGSISSNGGADSVVKAEGYERLSLLLGSDSPKVISAAAGAIGKTAKVDSSGIVIKTNAVPRLISHLNHEDSEVRSSAATALARVVKSNGPFSLVRGNGARRVHAMLRRKNSTSLNLTMGSIGKLAAKGGAEAVILLGIVPELVSFLRHERDDIRRSAMGTLEKIAASGGADAVMNAGGIEAAMAILTTKYNPEQWEAASLLGVLGEHGPYQELVPYKDELLRNDNTRELGEAVERHTSTEDENHRKNLLERARGLESAMNYEKAVRLYRELEMWDKVGELLGERLGKWDRVLMIHAREGNVSRTAAVMGERKGDWETAARLYIAAGEWAQAAEVFEKRLGNIKRAIKLYERSGSWDRARACRKELISRRKTPKKDRPEGWRPSVTDSSKVANTASVGPQEDVHTLARAGTKDQWEMFFKYIIRTKTKIELPPVDLDQRAFPEYGYRQLVELLVTFPDIVSLITDRERMGEMDMVVLDPVIQGDDFVVRGLASLCDLIVNGEVRYDPVLETEYRYLDMILSCASTTEGADGERLWTIETPQKSMSIRARVDNGNWVYSVHP